MIRALLGLLPGAVTWMAGSPVPALPVLLSIPLFVWAIRSRLAGLGNLYNSLSVLLDPEAWIRVVLAELVLRPYTGPICPWSPCFG